MRVSPERNVQHTYQGITNLNKEKTQFYSLTLWYEKKKIYIAKKRNAKKKQTHKITGEGYKEFN